LCVGRCLESRRIKIAARLFAALLLFAGFTAACGPSGDDLATMDAATVQAKATEIPFKPTQAWIRCSQFAHMGNAVTLWEHAGYRPVDSMPRSNKGREVGALKDCTPVETLDRQWSVYDDEFYYLVDGAGQHGWVSGSFIVFEESENVQSSPPGTE
jgi:hypothetical protein